MGRKATAEEYDKAVEIYQTSRDGQSAVEAYAEKLGIDSYSFCEPCEIDTPDCESGVCLICGTRREDA